MDTVNKPVNKLRWIMSDLHQKATLHPGQPQRRELPSGLRVDVLIKDSCTHLQLSRSGVYPSETEWSVVLANFPYDPPLDIAIHRVEATDGRKYLRSSWSV